MPADGLYILLQLGVCVGNGIGKINLLVLLLEVVLELQLVFDEVCAIPTQSLHELHVIALALPPLFGGGRVVCDPAEGVGPHAFVVEIFILGDVADVELDSAGVGLIIDFKIIPIGVAASVGVAADEAVVL